MFFSFMKYTPNFSQSSYNHKLKKPPNLLWIIFDPLLIVHLIQKYFCRPQSQFFLSEQ